MMTDNDNTCQGDAAAGTGAAAAATRHKRILIVDDEPTIQLTLSYALRAAGFEVVTASRLESAEAALERYPFEMVIADIRMSGILGVDGLELLSYIKRHWPGTGVIIMTAYGSEEIRQDALARGASWYYNKPIDIADLISRLGDSGGGS